MLLTDHNGQTDKQTNGEKTNGHNGHVHCVRLSIKWSLTLTLLNHLYRKFVSGAIFVYRVWKHNVYFWKQINKYSEVRQPKTACLPNTPARWTNFHCHAEKCTWKDRKFVFTRHKYYRNVEVVFWHSWYRILTRFSSKVIGLNDKTLITRTRKTGWCKHISGEQKLPQTSK